MEWLRAEALRQTKLAFDDLVNQFNAAENTPCVEEALETKHWSHAAFYPPGIADRPLVGLPTFLELWDVADNPAQDCARGDADAKFPGQLGQVPVAKLKAQVPPHTGNDNIVSKPAAAKERMTQ